MKKRILVADDEASVVKIIMKESPSILILDLQMPKMNGMEVLKEIKKRTIEITVIVLTAFGTIEKAVEAMKEGAYDFIQKPIDLAHLEIVISKVSERNYLKKRSETLQSKLQEQREEISYLKREIGREYDFSNIIGMNKELQNVLSTVRKVVYQNLTSSSRERTEQVKNSWHVLSTIIAIEGRKISFRLTVVPYQVNFWKANSLGMLRVLLLMSRGPIFSLITLSLNRKISPLNLRNIAGIY